ncbi:MAG: DUF707 domain-containing protein [Prevotella sp.]|nr:DUF707 domain-containing protein [Prevotella sp.]
MRNNNRLAILFLTNHSDLAVVERIKQLMQATSACRDVYVLFNLNDGVQAIPDELQALGVSVFTFFPSILYEMGYQPLGDSLVYGNCHFPALKFFKQHPNYDYYWVIEDDVQFTGDWRDFFDKTAEGSSDLLTTFVRNRAQDSAWGWWTTLDTGDVELPSEEQMASFNPAYRLSKAAMKAIDEMLSSGWRGHNETVIPTIIRYCHLSISDMKAYSLYTTETYSDSPLQAKPQRADMLYHPIKTKISGLQLRKNCVITAAGSSSLHENWIGEEGNRSFDLHIIVYDNCFGKFYDKANFLAYGKGQKLKLIYAYLKRHPEYLSHYDYFFLPDDDINTDAAHIEQLFSSMEKYHLQIAQPCLHHSFYTYYHTLCEHDSRLRYTNFVEMMMPCFSRDALAKVLDTFNANESGWGIEFHWASLIKSNHRDMAILDDVPMVHTKPVVQGRSDRVRELEDYIEKHHLSKDIVEYGYVPEIEQKDVDMQAIHHKRQRAAHYLLRLAVVLENKLQNGSITRPGKDGRENALMLLKQISDITEARFPILDKLSDFVANHDSPDRLEFCYQMYNYSDCLAKEQPSANHELFRSGWNMIGWILETCQAAEATGHKDIKT